MKRELAALMTRWRRRARIITKEAGNRLGLSARAVEGIEQGRGLALLQAAKSVAIR